MDGAVDRVLTRLMTLHPKVIDLSLDRIENLLDRLGNPETALPPVIHVAGTNGKGSVVAFLRALLEAAGLRCHVYTSPHLVRFNERIRLAGTLIGEDALLALLEECEATNGQRPITFFEITTAAAFLAFARHQADVCLLETGLGGRLDATNLIARPRLTAITPVSLDHQSYLGDTLAAIAHEKAGILKPGVPCVLARQERAAFKVIRQQASQRQVPLYLQGEHWYTTQARDHMIYRGIDSHSHQLPPPALLGAHQEDNAAQALACCQAAGFALTPAQMASGLRQAHWPARLQRLESGPLVSLMGSDPGWQLWLDGGHNPGAAKALAAQARRWRDRPLYLILGSLANRDPAQFVKPLAGRIRQAVAVPIAGDHDALSAQAVQERLLAAGVVTAAAPDVASAVQALAANHRPGRILIAGSLYLAGAVLAQWGTIE